MPVQRPVSGPALSRSLDQKIRTVREPLATTARSARTFVRCLLCGPPSR